MALYLQVWAYTSRFGLVRAGLRLSGLMFTGLGYICKSGLGLCLQVWAFAYRSGLIFKGLGLDLEV